MISDELQKIRKLYGEEMMHLCRKLFPTVLEQGGLLLNTLLSSVKPTHSLAKDIKEKHLEQNFKNWIFYLTKINAFNNGELIDTGKNPFELMEEAGYTLYECKKEKDIQSFRSYWDADEELCTFTSGNRLEINYVFFAVKKNAKDLKREDFICPERQDEYGTSVISIQFSREDFMLTICNRYNHTIQDENPDATFSNNLENIIGGLTKSFQNYFGYDIIQEKNNYEDFLTQQLSYTKDENGVFYRYNIKKNNISYCENNTIIDNGKKITKYQENNERYLVIDYFIVDMKTKEIYLYDSKIKDSFIESIASLGKILKMELNKKGNTRVLRIIFEDKEIKITIDDKNNIIGYENNYVEKIEDNFLQYNKKLKNISINNAKEIKNNFLEYNQDLEEFTLSNVVSIADNFLEKNRILKRFEANNLISIGNNFCFENREMRYLSLPSVESILNSFMPYNNKMKEFDAVNAKVIGNHFMRSNKKLEKILIPSIKKIGFMFLVENGNIDQGEIFEVICQNVQSDYKRI